MTLTELRDWCAREAGGPSRPMASCRKQNGETITFGSIYLSQTTPAIEKEPALLMMSTSFRARSIGIATRVTSLPTASFDDSGMS